MGKYKQHYNALIPNKEVEFTFDTPENCERFIWAVQDKYGTSKKDREYGVSVKRPHHHSCNVFVYLYEL